MADFDDIETGLNCHFCPNCKTSFECRDEDGSCGCPGNEHSDDSPWCDECAQKAEEDEEETDGICRRCGEDDCEGECEDDEED